MSAEPNWLLVDRYLSGECTPDETKSMDEWVASDPSHARLLASMRRVWSEAATPLPHVDEQAAWLALQARRGPVRSTALPVSPSSRMSFLRQMTWRTPALAAGLVVAAAVGTVGWWKHARDMRLGESAPPRQYITARGQRAELTLIDGTRVSLSTDSRLQVPQSYGAMTRDVRLDGEAYFVVQHDAKRPFRVHAGSSVSEDLGTEFDVRAYPGDSDAVVIVASGRVSLRQAAAPAVRSTATELSRGQMGRLDRKGDVRVLDGVDFEASLAWRHGHLMFEERPLRDVARELERWYDIDIALDDSTLASAPLTASFTNQSADDALAIIAGTLGVHYTRDGREVRITATAEARK